METLEDTKMGAESSTEETPDDRKPEATTVVDDTKKRPRSDTAGYDDDDDETAAVNATMEKIAGKGGYSASVAAAASPSLQPLLKESLEDMLDGIPRKEMKMIVSEAKECEDALEKELEQLKIALEREIQAAEEADGEEKKKKATPVKDAVTLAVDIMLDSEVTPPDHYWTVSSLLGRLRHDLTTPLPPNSEIQVLREKAGIQTVAPPPAQKKRKSSVGAATAATAATDVTASGRSTPVNSAGSMNVSQFERLKQVREHPDYTVKHETTDRLMAVWKKISTHRSSLVFRRPVSDKDAPGYSDRIHFKMDLSLIRKLIVNGTIKSYSDLAQRIHLIAHNCVKYNGRESDYALVTREFESYAAEFLMTATHGHGNSNVVVPNPVGRPGKKRVGTPTAGSNAAVSAGAGLSEIAPKAAESEGTSGN
jgi:hypothetical protein